MQHRWRTLPATGMVGDMAPPRIEVVGGFYHVNANSVEGTKLFADDYDRQLFLDMFAEQARLSGGASSSTRFLPRTSTRCFA